MSFDFESSSSEYLRINDTLGITDYPFSAAAWVKLESISTAGSTTFAMTDASASTFIRQILNVSGTSKVACFSDGTGVFGTTVLATGTWYFISAVWASATDRRVYLNGVQEGIGTVSATFNANLDNSTVGTWFRFNNPEPNTFMDGLVETLHVYNRALSANELIEIMYKPYSIANGLIYAPDLLSSFSTVADIKDLSGNGNVIDSGTVPSLSGDEPGIYFPQLTIG